MSDAITRLALHITTLTTGGATPARRGRVGVSSLSFCSAQLFNAVFVMLRSPQAALRIGCTPRRRASTRSGSGYIVAVLLALLVANLRQLSDGCALGMVIAPNVLREAFGHGRVFTADFPLQFAQGHHLCTDDSHGTSIFKLHGHVLDTFPPPAFSENSLCLLTKCWQNFSGGLVALPMLAGEAYKALHSGAGVRRKCSIVTAQTPRRHLCSERPPFN